MLERERKFLIKEGESLPIEDMIYIKQGYLIADEDKQLRIRLIYEVINSNEGILGSCVKAILGYKKHINDTDKDEHETAFDIESGKDIYNNCKWKIEKYRAKVGRWEVDRYNNLKDNKSLVVAEIEYSDVNPFPDELPRWVGGEVTGQKEYSNIVLAKNN